MRLERVCGGIKQLFWIAIVVGVQQVQIDKKIDVKPKMFSFPSILTFVVGAQNNLLIETVLLSTHNICVG